MSGSEINRQDAEGAKVHQEEGKVGRLCWLAHLGLLGVLTVTLMLSPARADVAATGEGWREEERLALDEGVVLLRRDVEPVVSAPEALLLWDGQRWPGRLVRWSPREVVWESTALGERMVEVGRVWALDLRADLPVPPGVGEVGEVGEGVLLRAEGEPLAGQLLLLDEARAVIRGSLGVVTLPRGGLVRYLLASPGEGERERALEDSVTLVDGTVLRGALTVDGDRFALTGPDAEELAIPRASVRLVRQSGVTMLSDFTPTGVTQEPWLSGAVSLWRVEGGDLALQPGVELMYAVPEGATRLAARVRVAEGSRGAVRLRVTAGETMLHEAEYESGDEVAGLSMTLPERATAVTIAVDWGEGMERAVGVLPARIVLELPHMYAGVVGE